jgi:hypothetical protein
MGRPKLTPRKRLLSQFKGGKLANLPHSAKPKRRNDGVEPL